MMDAHVELHIEDVDKVHRNDSLGFQCLTGCLSRAAPFLFGLVWKSKSRPHHALALDAHLEHTRGPPPVHAPMRVCRRPELGPGFHVELRLVPLRDEQLQGERVRYVYQAGGSSEADRFCEGMYGEIERAAERAVGELQGLLGEVRQMDLKLEEVRLMQRGAHGDAARRKLMRLKRMLIALAADAEEATVAHTRYTRPTFRPKHLIDSRRIVRFNEELNATEGMRRRLRVVALLSGLVLALAALAQLAVQTSVWDRGFGENHEAGEFHAYACRTRPWQYVCNATAGTIQYVRGAAREANATCADVVAPYAWGAPLLDHACDRTIQQQSFWFFLPLPFLLFATVILPLGLFYGNAHIITLQKTLIWTPLVPLILLQCVFRTAVLASVVNTAADTTYALTEALVSVVLTLQVAVFLSMDAMRYPTALLRIGFALALLYRFGASVVQRATVELSSEQDPLLEPSHWLRATFEGLGAARKQSIISSVDWTISAMLFSTIISVINFPNEMAVVRLRCDTRRYFNFRDQYLAAMRVRAHRRDLDAADAALWLRAKFPVWLDRQKQRMHTGLQRAQTGLLRAKTSLYDLSRARTPGAESAATSDVESRPASLRPAPFLAGPSKSPSVSKIPKSAASCDRILHRKHAAAPCSISLHGPPSPMYILLTAQSVRVILCYC